MEIFDQIELHKNNFTRTDTEIYNNLLKFPRNYVVNNINQISKNTNFSVASITRFAKKVGFSGFKDFQYQLEHDLKYKDINKANNDRESKQYALLSDEIINLSKTDDFQQLSKLIKESAHVYTLGLSFSRLAAEMLSLGLLDAAEGKIETQFLPFDEVWRPFTSSDLIIIYSVMDGHFFTELLRKIGQKKRPTIVLVTMNKRHNLIKYSDYNFVLPVIRPAFSSHQVTLELTAFNIFNDCLLRKIKGEL